MGDHQKAGLLGSGVSHLYFQEETKVQEVKALILGHSATKWWTWNMDPSPSDSNAPLPTSEITLDLEESFRNSDGDYWVAP